MNFKQFKEEFEGADFNSMDGYYFAHTFLVNDIDVSVKYDSRLGSFDVYHKAKILLDDTDLRTAKAFIKLGVDNGRSK